MRYTVKQVVELFSKMDPNEVVHLWYRHRVDYEDLEADELVAESDWSRLADYQGRIEDDIDEVMRDLIEDDSQRYDYK